MLTLMTCEDENRWQWLADLSWFLSCVIAAGLAGAMLTRAATPYRPLFPSSPRYTEVVRRIDADTFMVERVWTKR